MKNGKGAVVGLFAGIGGFELGLGRVGYETKVLCELMPEARAVLRHAKEEAVSNARLVVDVESDALERSLPARIEILTAGFPCQDLSQAGQTAGIFGSRSSLVSRVFDLVENRPQKRRPRWIVFENVSFMRHLAGGEAMRFVLSRLSELGYSWAYREIDAMAFGLPQRRKRLFIVACREGEGDPRTVLFRGESDPDHAVGGNAVDWRDGIPCGFYWTEGNRGTGFAVDSVPTIKGGSGLGIPSPPAIVLPEERIVLPHIRDAERLQGFPRGWTRPAARVDPRGERTRWKLVGNAVSVPVAQWIGEGIATNYLNGDRPGDVPLGENDRWPQAAWRMAPEGQAYSARLGDWPVVKGPKKSLSDILRADKDQIRPELSLNATAGFLKRFRASSLLSRNPGLRDAFIGVLEKHVRDQRQ